jgi:uncharacterized protein YqgC (DUF456 family)
MKGFYAALRVISAIAGVAAIVYGLTQGRHGSSTVTSGIILLVVAVSTVYARRGGRQETSGVTATGSGSQTTGSGGAQGLAPRQVYVVIGLIVLFAIIGFVVADAIGAPTTGPGPPAVIGSIGCIVGCSIYSLVDRLRR